MEGKYGSGARETIEWMIKNIPNCYLVPRIKGASSELTTLSFIEGIQNGNIIEASIEKDGSVWGTDINNLSPDYLYVYGFSPESVTCLKTCPQIDFLSVNVYTTDRNRLRRAISWDWKGWENLDDFLTKIKKDEQKNEYQLDDINCFVRLDSYKIKPKKILQKIKEYNDIHHNLTNLDNFIK